LPAREPRRIAARENCDPERPERPVHAAEDLADGQPEVARSDRDLLEDRRHRARQLGLGVLEQETAALRGLMGREVARLAAAETNRSLEPTTDESRRKARRDEAQRRLAGIVRPDDAEHATRPELEVDAVERHCATAGIGIPDRLESQDRRHRRITPITGAAGPQ